LHQRQQITLQHQDNYTKKILIIAICLLVAGCSVKRPMLYPNTHLNNVGQAQAQLDIDECWRMAEGYVNAEPGKEVAKDAAKIGTVGAASGAAAGAVWGDAGRGAAAGAAGGLAGGVAAGVMEGSFKAHDPSPVFKNFVNRCLRQKGYEPIGWQ
jgi:outer membrane lipoprotein SlyB